MVMKAVTITWPSHSRLLNSTLLISWMSISNFQGALGTMYVEKIMKHLVLRSSTKKKTFLFLFWRIWFIKLRLGFVSLPATLFEVLVFDSWFPNLAVFYSSRQWAMYSCDVDSSSSILKAEYHRWTFFTDPLSQSLSYRQTLWRQWPFVSLSLSQTFAQCCTYLQRYQSQQ